MNLGEKLQQLRKSKGISQQKLAYLIGVSRQTISEWEISQGIPDIQHVVQLSKLFGVSTDYLLYDDFNSVRNIPIVEMNSADEKRRYRHKLLTVTSFISFVLGLFGVIIFLILSFVVPARKWISGRPPSAIPYEEAQNGLYPQIIMRGNLWVFLKTYNLEFLFVLCCILMFVGLVLIIKKYFVKETKPQ